MKRVAMAVAFSMMLLVAGAAWAGQIGFEEDFALAKDRGAVLKTLIPGTEEYYFYTCLYLQETGKLDEVDALLKQWIDRHNRTQLVIEIENRQALLKYEKDPQGTMKYLQQRLGLTFLHERQVLGQKPTLATALDSGVISRDAFLKRALANQPNTVNGFEDSGIEWFIRQDLTPDQRRAVLQRITRPDYPNLPKLVADDLAYKFSGGFGSMPIHARLLLAQLDELLKIKPDLLNQRPFVNIYLTKLQPSADVDIAHDKAEREAYLDRVWAFASKLDPVHNSLKADVLYNRLAHDRALGLYDLDRFLEYVKLPRNVFYINREYLKAAQQRGQIADMNASFADVARILPINVDEPLVRDYLTHFFLTDDSTKKYEPYIDDVYLKHLFAETKLVNGIGDPEQWYSMLPPETLKGLKERIDLNFVATDKTFFAPDEPVKLDMEVKNVPKLIVKVFEINTLNFYRERGEEIGTDVNLDGLVANEEKTYAYADPPLRRVRRSFDFPTLNKRGVFIVEFIGNGQSSRALVRKGQLRMLTRTSSAGQVFTILDESNRKVPAATLWFGGREFSPDKDGAILLPFSTAPASQAVILRSGDFATLARFQQEAETYALTAGLYVDREALIKRNKATLIVRPSLAINGTPVSLGLLEEVTLAITSVDAEGVATSKEVPGFKLFEDRESTYDFAVPESCTSVSFQLKAKVQNVSQGQKQDLAVSEQYALNGIDATVKTEDLHLRRIDGKYTLNVLGKTGEDLSDRPVALAFKHEDFKDAFNLSLKSDASGDIELGDLAGIQWVRATGAQGVSHQWFMLKDIHSFPQSIDAAAGDIVFVPWMSKAAQPSAEDISLLEVRAGTYTSDQIAKVAIKDGFLALAGLEPGDYDLVIKPDHVSIRIRVTKGARVDDYVLGENRQFQVLGSAPLQIASVEADKDNVRIRLANATALTRVHVVADRFMPEYSLPGELGKVRFPDPTVVTLAKSDSFYVEGRDIGDEYRYILERKYATKFPGNMLTRPGLLLNPWAVRKTETGVHGAQAGEEFAEGGQGGSARAGKGYGGSLRALQRGKEAISSNLDFLPKPAAVLLNLRPDAQGIVTIARKDLGAHTQIHILACDPFATVYRELSLSDAPMDFLNLCLNKEGLDPAKHFTERKEISALRPGEKLLIADASASKVEVYDTVAVYSLFATLSKDATLDEFSFILNWPKLTDAQKQEKYSKYACHELNVFLMHKDPAFFTKVVQPYLRNKKDKTFVDQYLIQADLSGFMKPWAHGQLNVAEQAFLADRIANEKPATAAHVGDLYDLLPPDIERFNMLFKTALKGSSLEAETTKLATLMEKAEEAKRATGEFRAGRFARGGGGTGGSLFADTGRPSAPAPAAAPASKLMTATAASNAEQEIAGLKNKDMEESVDKSIVANFDQAKKQAKADVDMLAERELRDDARRESVRRLYRQLPQTEEFAENNYYHRLIEDQNAGLVTVNAFWRDFAKRPAGDFLSTNVADSSRNFTDMMLALGVTDLPFEAAETPFEQKDASVTITAATPCVVYHREIKEAALAPDGSILVGQNFFAEADRFVFVDNEKQDKYVNDEFLVGTVYGCKVVVTNTSSAPQKLDVLMQIPKGSMPVKNGFRTRSVNVDLAPYNTTTIEYFFYFPSTGKFQHYPVQVAKNEKVVASSAAVTLNVVTEPSKVDTTSWDYISQNGTPEQVLAWLKTQNVERVDLSRIAWRMKDEAFFRQALPVLEARHVYDDVLWSYGIRHNEPATAREYLQHQDGFVSQCGQWLDAKLLSIDPVARKSYQHLEYSPLVNARAHRLGKRNVIVNDRFFEQYERLMKVLAYRPALDDDDMMSLAYYLLLQDRVEDGMAAFAQVKPEKLSTQIQYDYLRCYLDFYTDAHAVARGVAAKYAAYPVDRWRNLFANVVAQLDEAEGKAPKIVDKESREQQQANLAATETSFDFKVEAKQILIDYQNVTEAKVNYYLMDVELLFSRSPFVQEYSGQFAFIRPNETAVVALPAGAKKLAVPLPAKFHASNVMIEIEAGGVRKSQAYFSNSLATQIVENYGLLYVSSDAGKPLPRTYVKVFARMNDGSVRFYKDGYTDLRGCFDYTSLSTGELDNVEKFSVLIMSDTAGAVVKEVNPPKR